MRSLILFPILAVPLVAGSPPTFHADVEPILQANCQACHRPHEAAPMSFLTYEETRPWARAIQEAVALDRMPPWFAEPPHERWVNAHVLSAADKRTLFLQRERSTTSTS